MIRHDYAHPLRVDAASHQIARADYPQHVRQLVTQLLLTSPGERVCLPEFGCGLRRLVFAPQSDALTATVRIQVKQAVDRWLADQIELIAVEVESGRSSPDSGLDEGAMLITVSYSLIETRAADSVSLKVS